MALVGSYVALSKPLAAAIPVFLLAWMRFGIGGLAMVHWLKKPADEPPLTPQVRRLLFLESFLGNFLFTVCMIYGVSLTSAVSAGAVAALTLVLRPADPEAPNGAVAGRGKAGTGAMAPTFVSAPPEIESLDVPNGSGTVLTMEDEDGGTAIVWVTPDDVEGI